MAADDAVNLRAADELLEVSISFTNAARASPQAARERIAHHGQLLLTKVRANASGRPGPRAVTGDYRRSISLTVGMDMAGRPSAVVGTNRDQGRRLEFGFNDTDSLGRRYHQPPYPHFEPALRAIERPFLDSMSDLTVSLFRGGRL